MKINTPKLSALIKEWKFDYVNSNITDNLFEEPKEILNDYKLFLFDKYISSENAIKEMKKEGYRPANAWELLLWTEWNDKEWVVALDSVCGVSGNRGVPDLDGSASKRSLGLSWFDGGWSARCRFLGVALSSETLKLSPSHLKSPLTLSPLEKWETPEGTYTQVGKVWKKDTNGELKITLD